MLSCVHATLSRRRLCRHHFGSRIRYCQADCIANRLDVAMLPKIMPRPRFNPHARCTCKQGACVHNGDGM